MPHMHNNDVLLEGSEPSTPIPRNYSPDGLQATLNPDLFNICVGNARSIGNKIETTANYLHDQDLDMYLVVESWLSEADEIRIGDLEENGYKVKITPREDRKGGGIICIHKTELNVTKINPPFPITTMEFMEVMLTYRSRKVRFVTIYRPNPGKNNRYTMTNFYKEFAKLMSHYNLTKEELIVCGDFNFHINKPTDPETRKFMDILSSFSLTQHINEPTHDHGNTLDLLITRSLSILVNHKDLRSCYNTI